MTGHENDQQEKYDIGLSSSCSSPAESYDGDDHTYNLEITDESHLDGEVGKRLYEMIPVPVSIASVKYFLYVLYGVVHILLFMSYS